MKKTKKPSATDKIDHVAEAHKAKDHLRNDKDLNKAYPLSEPLTDTANKGN